MEYYINFAIIFTLINAVITAIAYSITKKNGKKSPCLIFAVVDVILTVIAGVVVLFCYIGGAVVNSLSLAIPAALFLASWLPVALILLIIAIGLHFVFKRSK